MLASMASALALMASLASPPVHTNLTLAASGDLLIHKPVWSGLERTVEGTTTFAQRCAM